MLPADGRMMAMLIEKQTGASESELCARSALSFLWRYFFALCRVLKRQNNVHLRGGNEGENE